MNHTSHLRGLLAAGVSVAALIGAAPAFAAPAPASSGEATVGEVIVTAEKREASIQNVPVAVTAFTSKERALEGINTVQDMTNFTPGLTYSSQLDRPVMRGLARNNNVYLSDSAVAVYYDDFFSQSTFLVGRDDMLIDQVEVLLGPQGTLYGRNAVGGLINTISKKPSEDLGGEVRLIAGNYGYSKVEGTITGPIGNTGWTFRASGVDLNQYQGYFKNVAGGPSEGDVRHDPYGDFQLQYKGDKNEFWLDAYVLGFNNDRGGPGGLLAVPTAGTYDTAITTQGNLSFNPNVPYNPANVVPGSVVGMVPGANNPSASNIRTFAHAIPTNIELNADDNIAIHFIHHFDGFDVKYVGGYSQYHYNLNTSSFFGNDNSSITQYTLSAASAALPAGCQNVPVAKLPVAGGSCSQGRAGLTVFPEQNFQYETFTRWYSHELNFTSTGNGPLSWIGGVYRYDEIDDNSTPVSQPMQPQVFAPFASVDANGALIGSSLGHTPANPTGDVAYLRYQDHIMSTGVFGQLDYKLTDTFKLTGGVRYTYDQKNGTQETRYVAFNSQTVQILPIAVDATQALINEKAQPGVTRLPTLQTTGKYAGDWVGGLGDTSNAVTGTAGVEWTPDHQTLVYARYNRGYKAFGFNAGGNPSNVEAKPEFVNDFELGVKKGFGRRIQIDADVFYYDYTDAQIPIGVIVGGTTELTEFINIPSAVSDGVELTANWEPIDHLNLSLVYGFNNTSISSGCRLVGGAPTGFCVQDPNDTNATAAGARPVGPFGATNPAIGGAVGTGTGALQSVKGSELPQAPKNKVAFNANYTWVFEPGNLTLSGTYIWKDKSYASIFDRTYDEAPSWNQVDARLTWSGNHDKYEVVLYVKNMFNTLGYDAAGGGYNISTPVGGGAATQAPSYDLTPPRLFGMELHYKF